MLLKKSIAYFMNFMYKHIFLNFGVISFVNKEMVSFLQLHTYKFGLVYNWLSCTPCNNLKLSVILVTYFYTYYIIIVCNIKDTDLIKY